MKICFLPYYSPYKNFASSRIRGLNVCDGINEIDGWSAGLGLPHLHDADVIVVGKMGHNGMVDVILEQKKRGAMIILDVCDPIFQSPGFRVIHKFADLITVPTHNLRAMFQKWQDEMFSSEYIPSAVWLDGIDFKLLEPFPASTSTNVGWHGNWNTVDMSLNYLRHINRFPTFVICQKEPFMKKYNHPCVDWDAETLIPEIRKMGLAIICHPPDCFYKSDNKLLLTVACGVPVMTNEGSALDWTLTEAGINGRVNPDPRFTEHQIVRLMTEVDMRQAYLDKVNVHIFKSRTYKHQAQQLIKIIESFSR